MKTFLIIYGIIALLHGLWSLRMQRKYHPNSVGFWKMVLVFLINSIGFPITIPWAIINKQWY